MHKLTYETQDKNITFLYEGEVIHTGTTDELHTIRVIYWLRVNLGLGLAEAKKIWDDSFKENPVPNTGIELRREKREKETKEFEERVKNLKPLTQEQIMGIIGTHDKCTCGHLGQEHKEEDDSCTLCNCNSFVHEDEAISVN